MAQSTKKIREHRVGVESDDMALLATTQGRKRRSYPQRGATRTACVRSQCGGVKGGGLTPKEFMAKAGD